MLSDSGWRPVLTIEAVLMHILCNLSEGGGRIDFDRLSKERQ